MHSEPNRTRVLVDASIVKPGLAGIATYTLGLVTALATDPTLNVSVATSWPEFFAEAPGVTMVRLPTFTRHWIGRAIWREVGLRRSLASAGADCLLVPVPEVSFRRLGVPAIIVVHDVSQIVAPALYGWPKWWRYVLGLRHACRAASEIVCVSQATRLGLHYTIGPEPSKCRVISVGPRQTRPQISARAETRRPYLLYIGTLMPHKNVDTLLKAFDAARNEIAADLLLAGPATESEHKHLQRVMQELGLGERVQHVGYVAPEELKQLLGDAVALVLPSVIEGFGAPVLDAMSVGTPVLCSEIPATREVAGDAAFYVATPLVPEAWSSALTMIWHDHAAREQQVRRGKRRAGLFSWDTVGREMGDVLRAVTASRAPRVLSRAEP